MANHSNLDKINERENLFNIARTHAESVRAEMGDEWADELIEDFRQQGLLEVSLFMETVQATGEARKALETNLLKKFA